MRKVVVAEDDGQLRPWIAGIVEELGFCCLQASNGLRALHLLEDNPDVALLISDAMMPELNGEELVYILRGRELSHKMPIIFISAVRRFEEMRRLQQLGDTYFASKPLNQTCLRDLIRETTNHVATPALSHH